MMKDARRRKFDIVLVWKFDRFARSTKHLLSALDEFRSLGIDFFSYSENIDTSTPMGEMIFTIFAALAQFERALIVERVNAGMAHAKKHGTRSGKAIGRPVEDNFDVHRARELRDKGMSWRKLEKELGAPQTTIRRRLNQRKEQANDNDQRDNAATDSGT
jgi:DNA invertase Pin-like site-specific DNA recombinase